MSWPWFSSLFFSIYDINFSVYCPVTPRLTRSQRATGFLFCTGAYIGALFLHFDHSFGIQDFWTVFSMTSSSRPCLVWVLQVWLWLDFLNAERASLIVACNDCCVVFATSTPSHLPLLAIMTLFVYNAWDYDRFVEFNLFSGSWYSRYLRYDGASFPLVYQAKQRRASMNYLKKLLLF
jgi:hypothetical protein